MVIVNGALETGSVSRAASGICNLQILKNARSAKVQNAQTFLQI
jgi:hypothetical protein